MPAHIVEIHIFSKPQGAVKGQGAKEPRVRLLPTSAKVIPKMVSPGWEFDLFWSPFVNLGGSLRTRLMSKDTFFQLFM